MLPDFKHWTLYNGQCAVGKLCVGFHNVALYWFYTFHGLNSSHFFTHFLQMLMPDNSLRILTLVVGGKWVRVSFCPIPDNSPHVLTLVVGGK